MGPERRSDRPPRRTVAPRQQDEGRPYLALGSLVVRRYGLTLLRSPNFSLAASSSTVLAMITSWPCFQSAGVATEYFEVSCSESMTRRISSKLRPVEAG